MKKKKTLKNREWSIRSPDHNTYIKSKEMFQKYKDIYINKGFPLAQQERICLQCRIRRRCKVHSLGQEDPLEKGMATHPNILVWRIYGQRSLAGLQSVELQRVKQLK